MTWIGCPREHEVSDAARSARWTTALRAHAGTCRHCAEVTLVTTALCAPAAPARTRALQGDPSRLWMHARLARRLRAETVVSRFVTGVQMALGLAMIAGLGYTARRLEIWTTPTAELGLGLAAYAAMIAAMFIAATKHTKDTKATKDLPAR